MSTYGKLNLSALLLTIAWGGGIPAVAADIVEEKETPAKAQDVDTADTSGVAGDTLDTEEQGDTADTSGAVAGDTSDTEEQGDTADSSGAVAGDTSDTEEQGNTADSSGSVTGTSDAEGQETGDLDQQFDQIHNKMTATHPEEAEQFKQEYHASKDKKKVLEDWVHHALESQDMLDAVDELFAIYQILRSIDRDASNTFEQRVQDEQDPRNVLEYAHQLLLKTLKDRREQVEAAKAELRSIVTILEYVSLEKAREIEQIKQSAEDPRTQVDEAYEVLEKALEAAHKEVGLAPLE